MYPSPCAPAENLSVFESLIDPIDTALRFQWPYRAEDKGFDSNPTGPMAPRSAFALGRLTTESSSYGRARAAGAIAIGHCHHCALSWGPNALLPHTALDASAGHSVS